MGEHWTKFGENWAVFKVFANVPNFQGLGVFFSVADTVASQQSVSRTDALLK